MTNGEKRADQEFWQRIPERDHAHVKMLLESWRELSRDLGVKMALDVFGEQNPRRPPKTLSEG